MVEVRDSGTGLSAENQLQLFDNVVQFHANAQQGGGGSGLGLWISKKILDLHGGEIGVCSLGEGLGSLFYFSLPLSPSHAVNMADLSSSRSAPSVRGNQRRVLPLGAPTAAKYAIDDAGANEGTLTSRSVAPLVILVTDDSALNRKMMKKLFKKEGYVCREASDGDVAVQLVRESLGPSHPSAAANDAAAGADEASRLTYDVITMDNVRTCRGSVTCVRFNTYYDVR